MSVVADSNLSSAPPQGADKSVPPAPMPRDKGGWRVAPAPDGRGMPDEHKPTPPHRMRGFWLLLLGLLAINWLFVLISQPSTQPRVTVPFSPYFLQQLEAGKVKSISSRSDTINGTFTEKLRYPANDSKATATTLFATQVPSFWNSNQLTDLLIEHNVQVNAKNPNPGTSLLTELLVGFGPTLLLFAVIYFIARRAMRAGPAAGSAGSGTSAARRPAGSTRRRSW